MHPFFYFPGSGREGNVIIDDIIRLFPPDKMLVVSVLADF